MRLEVLISCMNQYDDSIIKRSGITTDTLIINQCDHEDSSHFFYHGYTVRLINVCQRGLSNSRNMAIELAQGDICLFCDDDEFFVNDYYNKIISAFEKIPEADIIVFRIVDAPCRLKRKVYKLSSLQCLKVSSWQIAFRRKSVQNSFIRFDPLMGSGSGNGCGEENKFLLDCIQKRLKIYHVPVEIASVNHKQSTWFDGYNTKFFYQRGIATRYMLGRVVSTAYAFYYILKKHSLYKTEISMRSALSALLLGIKNNDIEKEKSRAKK